jgi:DNA-binding NarL/FixJ family response regulator
MMHAAFRAQTALVLAGYEVVGSCADGSSALALISQVHPDLQLPDIDGFRLIPQLGGDRDRLPIVLISSREEVDYGARVGRSGAAGFITKAELSAKSLAQIIGHC